MDKCRWQGGTNCCPLRRLGNQPSPSLENIGLDPKSLLSSYHDRADSVEKIKREYHIKEEWGQDNDHYKDIAIKAEPGHHDKISLGLFPSDVKSSFLMSTVKIEHEEELKIEKTLTVVTPAADTVYASLRAEKILIVKEEKLFSETAVPRRSERRGYSASKEVKVELKKRNNMDDQDDETSCMKRKGAILRQIQS